MARSFGAVPLRDRVGPCIRAKMTGLVNGLDLEIDVLRRQTVKAEEVRGRRGRFYHLLDGRTELHPEKGEIGFAASRPGDPFHRRPLAGELFDVGGNPRRKRGQAAGEEVGNHQVTGGAGVVSSHVLQKGHPAVRRIIINESLVSVYESDALFGREPTDTVVERGNIFEDVVVFAKRVFTGRDG